MRTLSPAAAHYHAQFLRRVTEHARRDADAWLQAQAAAHAAARRSAVRADFFYFDPAGAGTQRVAAAQFERQFALCLESLELTIYGYCTERQFGWERRTETVFCAGRRPWWRRVLRPAPLLALRIKAGAGTAELSVDTAEPERSARGAPFVVRLVDDTQAALARLHAEPAPARPRLRRLLDWLGWSRRAATPSETDT